MTTNTFLYKFVNMEVSRKLELKSELSNSDSTQTQIHKTSIKRPFDVAFLMLPDEKLKQKQSAKKIIYENNNDEDEDVEVEEDPKQKQYFITQKQQIFDDPNILKANLDKFASTSQNERSAFTKVNNNIKERRTSSPNLSISPDLSYQNSLSPSPPIAVRTNYQSPPILSPNQLQTYQTNFLPENFPVAATSLQNHFLMKGQDLLQPKMRPIYRPDLAYNYQQFPAANNHQEITVRNPAAAILSSLLPPSLAALSLPAQNVCAKCNITFRMTSDLVYHMRSHHKNETSDMHKRRREEKLKCPVCAESFRERHHLTRHMTAHQDKDEDDNEGSKKII